MSDRMRLHAGVAVTLERRYADDLEHHIDEIAHHYFKAAQAGDREKTLDYTLRAAQRSTAKMAFEEATRLYERALKVAELGGVSGSRRSRIASELKRARAMATEPSSMPLDSGVLDQNVFLNEGDYWTVAFGDTKSRLRDTKGLHYLAQLIKNPGREIHALELVGLVTGSVAEPAGVADAGLNVGTGDLGDILDPEAKAAYKARLDDLREELETARAFNDDERAAGIQLEIDALVEQLSQAVGLGGRSRTAGGDAERARTSVTKAIKGAVSRIAASNDALGRHLETTLKTGTFCSYSPDERIPVMWHVR
jgi:hypothetical protein